MSKDPVVMLRAALAEAGAQLGVRLTAENGKFVLETAPVPPA